ncbi:hypothetical protein LTR64_007170 [Lithohypha guttulata]|uniref:Uncharacterized protein n=1 Tax=Lithohypha guttulata TaxID=1690604 RepID=A0AAN7YA16_9EURO|nr:hypothetical protein LTR51_004275 [Lithohypha guttulata]KAK5090882.1 hypothetical protein LTR05_001059 [Lithohypha guttulata]
MGDAEGRIQTYLAVFKHLNTLDVDWKGFAEELGISLTGNAQRKFKESLKKDGFQLAAGKITPLDGTNSSSKAAATPSKRKKKVVDAEGIPSKKRKQKKEEVVKEEEEVDGEVDGKVDEADGAE